MKLSYKVVVTLAVGAALFGAGLTSASAEMPDRNKTAKKVLKQYFKNGFALEEICEVGDQYPVEVTAQMNGPYEPTYFLSGRQVGEGMYRAMCCDNGRMYSWPSVGCEDQNSAGEVLEVAVE